MVNRFSKTTRIQQDVLNLIATENIGPGQRIPPEKELARDLGASVVTVQRALADLAHRDMIERIQGKGTFVKRALTGGAAVGALGFMLVNTSTFHYEELLSDVRRASGRRSHETKLIATGEHPDATVIDQLSGVSGVLMTGRVNDEWVGFLDMMHIPSVVIGSYRLRKNVWTVRYDFAEAAALMARCLQERGCRRMGIVNGARAYLPSEEIYRGVGRALDASGASLDDSAVVWCRKDRRFEDMAAFFAANPESFDALIVEAGCFHPLQMFLYEHGAPEPRPILGVVGDNRFLQQPFSKIEQVVFEDALGECAIDLLFKAMAGARAPA